jgi:hypothetical protein
LRNRMERRLAASAAAPSAGVFIGAMSRSFMLSIAQIALGDAV